MTRRPANGAARPGEVRLSAAEREAADDTMPDVPVEDRYEGNQLVPGRYRKYAALRERLKQQGRLN